MLRCLQAFPAGGGDAAKLGPAHLLAVLLTEDKAKGGTAPLLRDADAAGKVQRRLCWPACAIRLAACSIHHYVVHFGCWTLGTEAWSASVTCLGCDTCEQLIFKHQTSHCFPRLHY